MALAPDKQRKQITQRRTEADWADNKEDRRSAGGGAWKYYGRTVL